MDAEAENYGRAFDKLSTELNGILASAQAEERQLADLHHRHTDMSEKLNAKNEQLSQQVEAMKLDNTKHDKGVHAVSSKVMEVETALMRLRMEFTDIISTERQQMEEELNSFRNCSRLNKLR